MPPKNNQNDQPIDQGQLFPVEVSREHPAEIGEVVEGGVFPDELPATPDDRSPFHKAVHAAVVAEQQTRNRRIGQSGKHSPLERDGTYLQIKPGDYLPDFGPVKDSNWQAAKIHAQKLEAERQTKIAAQPPLLRPENDIKAVVAQTAAALAIERGLEDDEPVRTASRDSEPDTFMPTRRRAFGSVPNLLRDRTVDGTRIAALAHDDYVHVGTGFLKDSYLIKPGTKDKTWSYNGLALNRAEYSTILLSPETFKDRSAAKALKGHGLSNPLRRAEVMLSGPLHAFEGLQGKHAGLIGSLTDQQERLIKLAERANAPGFAHMNEVDLLLLVNEAWQLSFKNLIEVAARTNTFSPEQQENMEWALYDRLINGGQRDKIGYWQDMINVGINYAQNRRLTLVSSSNRVGSEIKKQQKKLDQFCEEHGILR